MSAARISRVRGRWQAVAPAAAMLALASTATLAGHSVAMAQARPQLASRPTTVSSQQIDHWGYYFGDDVKGDGDITRTPEGIRLPDRVVQVGSSNSTQYALLDNGTVWAWGQGDNGELGDGVAGDSFTRAVQVKFPAGVRIAFLATDAMPYDTALAVDTNGNAWGWGYNRQGELCQGNAKEHLTPVELPLTNVTTLAGADGHAIYDSNGTVYSCGADIDGVLGNGRSGRSGGSTKPVKVLGLSGQRVTEVVSSWQNAGVLLSSGRFYDWGWNTSGQVGDGSQNKFSDEPVLVNLPGNSSVTQVAEGGSTPDNGQTIVELSDGTLYAWGNDQWSQLGDGRTQNQASPEQVSVPSGVRFSLLASGGATCYGVTPSGDVYAWGNNAEGQVGNGGSKTSRKPVQVDTGANLISSTAGDVVVGNSSGG